MVRKIKRIKGGMFIMKKLFTLLLSLFLLVGCGGSKEGSDGTADTDSSTSSDKTVTVVSSLDVISMDTAVATDGTSFIAQTMCLAGLMELDENQNPIPDLAESYTVSDDGLVYTFKIRDDANWSNGEPVTAADFVYGWQRVVDPEIASEYNWMMETANIVNGNCYDAESGLTKEDLGVKALDEKTLEVTLNKPTGFFLSLMAFPVFFPANQAFVESCGDQYALSVDNILSCGPYTFSAWTAGYSYEFDLNEAYWDYDNYVAANGAEKVVFRVIADTQTSLLEYESGNLQTVILSGEQVNANKDAEGYTSKLTGYLYYLLLNINNSDSEDLQNLNIRQALSYALDRETIATALNDGSVAAEGIVPFALAGNPETGADFREDSGKLVSYDLETAKKYYADGVAELGHDVTIELLYGTDEGDSVIKAAEQIQSYLEEVGFTVNLNGKPKKERLSLQTEHSFEVALTRWGPDYGDPQTYMDLFLSTNTSNNQGGWASVLYDDKVLDAESGQVSALERWNDFVEAEKVLVQDEAAVIPVFQAGGAMLISPSISGIQFHSAGVDNYRHITVK